MLDSLVRVSRRVGWWADRLATDPMLARPRRSGAEERSTGTVDPVPVSRTPPRGPAGLEANGRSSVPEQLTSAARGTAAKTVPRDMQG